MVVNPSGQIDDKANNPEEVNLEKNIAFVAFFQRFTKADNWEDADFFLSSSDIVRELIQIDPNLIEAQHSLIPYIHELLSQKGFKNDLLGMQITWLLKEIVTT